MELRNVHYRVHRILPPQRVPCQLNPIDASSTTCVTLYETIPHCWERKTAKFSSDNSDTCELARYIGWRTSVLTLTLFGIATRPAVLCRDDFSRLWILRSLLCRWLIRWRKAHLRDVFSCRIRRAYSAWLLLWALVDAALVIVAFEPCDYRAVTCWWRCLRGCRTN